MTPETKRCEIAVIVPVHNAADFLPACLHSLTAQRFDDFRCILVDDGSTDASPDICDDAALNDRRFLVIHQAQSGVSAARIAGMRKAREEGAIWLAFCDADDCYHPDFLRTLHDAAQETALPLACCRYDTFTDTLPAEAPPPSDYRVLRAPEHLEALLHDHAVDYGLWNKLYAAGLLTEAMLDNDLAYNEDLFANWQAFLRAPGCAFCDFAGYHYRQHAASATHRALPPQSIDDQRRVATLIRSSVPEQWPELQQSANAFYYEKLVYLTSMILRRADADDYRVHLGELNIGITAGLKDPQLGRNPKLPFAIRVAAWATVRAPKLWRRICRKFLKDRQ